VGQKKRVAKSQFKFHFCTSINPTRKKRGLYNQGNGRKPRLPGVKDIKYDLLKRKEEKKREHSRNRICNPERLNAPWEGDLQAIIILDCGEGKGGEREQLYLD